MSTSLSGQLVTPQGVQAGELSFGERIEAVCQLSSAPERVIVPGFIDVHVHGGGGGDTMDGAEGVLNLARFHLQHGTTTLLPTTITNPLQWLLQALDGFSSARGSADDLPDLPGVHLEGPFISPQRLGAQPDFTVLPTDTLIEQLLAPDVIRVVTMAPELPGALAAAAQFAVAGVRVSLGHTTDDGNATRELLGSFGGTASFTHLFNAMGGIQARSPGVAGTALLDQGSYAELIFDRQHVHDDVLRLALHCKGKRLMFVTDAMRAAGLGDGPTELGGQAVTVSAGRAQLADGTLAGSVLTMDQAFRNALAIGLSLEQAVSLTSTAAASYLGLADRGQLAEGQRADLVVLDGDLNVEQVWVTGRRLV